MVKDEMKNKISMALKDPILQQGFEIICKENAELKEEIEIHVLLMDIIEAFDSCSYNDDFEMAQAGKEIYELFNGGKDPKEVFHNAEVPKSSRQLLKDAKEIIKNLLSILNVQSETDIQFSEKCISEAENFLSSSEISNM